MSADTKSVRAAGGKVSISDPEHNEHGSAHIETRPFKKYGTESSKNAMHGTAKVVAVGGKVSVSHDISGANEQPNYNSGTRVVTSKNGEISIQPFKVGQANGESSRNAGGASVSRPPSKKGGTKAPHGKEPVTVINQLKNSKTFRQTPRAKAQQDAGTRGSKAK